MSAIRTTGTARRSGRLPGFLIRHRRESLVTAIVVLLIAGIDGGILTGLFFLLNATPDVHGFGAFFLVLADGIVTLVGLLVGCVVSFVAGSALISTWWDITSDWRASSPDRSDGARRDRG